MDKQTKQAKLNYELLLSIFEILNDLIDSIKDIELNNRVIYLYVKKQQELEEFEIL